jgi:protein O-mannosyl-transferase
MAEPQVPEWTLDGVLDELSKIDANMRDRQFAFILGAGASFTSGIPTGNDLAQRWLKDMHLRECADGADLETWIRQVWPGEGAFSLANAAEHYPAIFERRFSGDREAGYAELETAMEGKSPSLGYSLLAEIIQYTRHKVVVTTNFDNLVADALAMHAHQSPLVVAHESLAGFVRPQLRRPLVAKIHRDLFLHPKNDLAGVATMEEGWKLALKKLFQYFTPVVVGYGGNDGSLMDMLADLDAGDIAGRMVWCYREKSPPPPKARRVLLKHQGLQVKIAGFDEFMLVLAARLVKDFDVADIAERTSKLGHDRAERYREQASKLRESSARGSDAQRQAGAVLSKSIQRGKSWWAWQMLANAEPDIAKQEEIYKQGLREFPASAELTGNYAIFVNRLRKDFDAAEALFKKALELDPSLANTTGNYAIFLENRRKDYDAAEVLYKRALELDPGHANITGNYANFLKIQRKDYDAAEALYKRALELDPGNANITGNYANFLKNQRKNYDAAEALYKKALELDPSNASNTGNYANFLKNQRKNYDAAEALFKKALELDPSHANNTGNYANFLKNQRKDYDAAEVLFKRALELDPTQVVNTGNYANFLRSQRKDYDAAEALYKKALELDPGSAINTGNYAIFLTHQRKDYDVAEALYKKALELDPSDAHYAGAYASFLANQRKDFDAAEALYTKALELDPKDPNSCANLASIKLLRGNPSSLEAAQSLVQRVLTSGGRETSQTTAEALLYGALMHELAPEAPDLDMLARLKGLLAISYERDSWSFDSMFGVVLPKLSEARQAFYRSLGEAILDESKVAGLDTFPEWRSLDAIDPFAPLTGP